MRRRVNPKSRWPLWGGSAARFGRATGLGPSPQIDTPTENPSRLETVLLGSSTEAQRPCKLLLDGGKDHRAPEPVFGYDFHRLVFSPLL